MSFSESFIGAFKILNISRLFFSLDLDVKYFTTKLENPESIQYEIKPSAEAEKNLITDQGL